MAGLRKQTKYNIADTNIALLGSDLEKKVREAAAKKEAAWKVAGKDVGLQIWRIEKFNVKSWPKDSYGTFYKGDSYIVLNTWKKAGENALRWDVHFWLGDETTQDEAGTAAYKTVELDDFLGGAPIQHREVQDLESALFLSYFPTPIKILEGGIETGFRHVKPEEYKPRLLHIKGKKKVRVSQVPLSCSSLNSGDCFILDGGAHIFTWIGKEAGVFEKTKAVQVAESIESERNGKARNETLSEDDNDERFWGPLGGRGSIKSAAEGGDDTEAPHGPKRLARVSDASGSIQFEQIAEGSFGRDKLNSSDAFVVDNGEEVFAWIGKSASEAEQKQALHFATQYLQNNNLPLYVPVTRIQEGKESSAFKKAFTA
ncbi:hypothetical protein PROFUN_08751 [Planoprotostelium fungivorum]|uniref:Gelsolin-like domain-containing protein n=1 Tax=Planoprotostelium fungivorum TaxID=1890364 RepID=A0A2P6ND53_9EUKA|nr:hypothetical protein PROFUN_08751 [Planoprotostelium fungivorum]